MNPPLLAARLSEVIYPVMISAGAIWGATGEALAGLAAMLASLAVVGLARR